MPCHLAGWDVAGRRADIGAECEETTEASKEVDVPGVPFGDRQLREDRIRIDEDPVGNGGVLVAPEPGTAREVHKQVGVGTPPPHIFSGRSVVGAVVVHETPSVAQAER